MLFPKHPRYECKKWLIAQREHPCFFTGSPQVEIDHLCKGSGRGMAYKSNDFWTLPIDFNIHREKTAVNGGEIKTFLKYLNEYPLTAMEALRETGLVRHLRWLVKNGDTETAIELLRGI